MRIFTGTGFRIGIHIFLGLLLGLLMGIIYLSSSSSFREFVQHKIEQKFATDYDCTVKMQLDSIDWVTCSLHFSGIHITPNYPAGTPATCSILAEKMHVTSSWLSLFMQGKFKVSVQLERMMMFESFEKTPEKLAVFCSKMFGNVVQGPIQYDLISMTESTLCLKHLSDGLSINIPYVCHLRSEKTSTRIQCYVQDGTVGVAEQSWIKNIDGAVLCDIPFISLGQSPTAQVQINYVVSKFEQEIPGFLTGKLHNGIGEFSLKTQDRSFILDPIKIQFESNACWCDTMVLATAQLFRYFNVPDVFDDLAGSVGLSLHCDLYNILNTLQTSIVFNDIVYQNKTIIPGGKLSILDHDRTGFSGIFSVNNQSLFQVRVQTNQETKKCTIHNVLDLVIPLGASYKILKHGCQVQIFYEPSGLIHANYTVDICRDDQVYCTIKGKLEIKDGKIRFWGLCNAIEYELIIRLNPELAFESFWAKQNQNLIVDLNTDIHDPKYVTGSVDFSIMHSLVPQPFKMSFAQEGSFILRGYLKDGLAGATVQTHYAHIRLPYIYNVLQNISATCEFDFYKKILAFKNIDIELYEGKIFCSDAKVYFDKNFSLDFMHAPLTLHDVMLSWNKGLYGLVTGTMLLQKISNCEPLQVQGQLMVQKAELKENIFSLEFQDLLALTGNSAATAQLEAPVVDVSLFTKEALRINTSFLNAQAVLGVHVKGPLYKTELAGSLKLLSGTLNFPYKSIDIVEGKLLFMPEQPFDPIIDFVAKGKLKRYHVTLKAWGSALDPHVQFESEPYLSEDQIISLLLLGVEDQSLSLMLPAFLTQKLKEIIFGPALSKVKLKSFFDVLLESLKYVRFIPQFSNQTGRGGVRGIFEIDATEHLQGKIDTNFSHLEDTKFDIDYTATDDVTLRLQKDGPSTYGGQVEFRWKFS
jgi:hypothetical protein